MPQRTVAVRIDALEEKVKRFDECLDHFDKTIERRFREQGEMFDERFAEVKTEISVVKTAAIALQKDMAIVREGVGIILKKLG